MPFPVPESVCRFVGRLDEVIPALRVKGKRPEGALFPPNPAFGREGGQACRSRPRKIPRKSRGVYLTFTPLPRDTYPRAPSLAPSGQFTLCPEPPLLCRGEGVIAPGSGETGGVSKGDSVPLRLKAAAAGLRVRALPSPRLRPCCLPSCRHARSPARCSRS